MKSHVLADYLPELSSDDLRTLADDIRQHGQREPIVMLDGKILDGRNRFAACKLARVEPRFRDFSPDQDGDPVRFVISANLQRRHLTDSQRATIAGELAKESERGRPVEASPAKCDDVKPEPMTQGEAAKLLNVKPSAVRRAVAVARKASKKVKAEVKAGKISLTKAAAVVKEPKPKQAAAAKVERKSPLEKMQAAIDQLWLDNRSNWNSHPFAKPEAVIKAVQKCVSATFGK